LWDDWRNGGFDVVGFVVEKLDENGSAKLEVSRDRHSGRGAFEIKEWYL
jgi:hypothetical protein